RCDDRMRGLGAAIGLWLVLSLLYDGLVLFLVAAFGDYPLERAVLGLTIANPVDLARVMLLLRFDISALMGYTGAVFQRFFGGTAGASLAAMMLGLWITAPVALGLRAFRQKDF
ncbi:MAG TPA: hypothetical protein VFK39_13020, partial [Gemmatimonadaceae bacterium]|nr:hypothetical protein [Gemmatimonadaceae bacterium]